MPDPDINLTIRRHVRSISNIPASTSSDVHDSVAGGGGGGGVQGLEEHFFVFIILFVLIFSVILLLLQVCLSRVTYHGMFFPHEQSHVLMNFLKNAS